MCIQKFSSMFVHRTRYAAWDFIARCQMTTGVNQRPPTTDTFSSLCQDQMVKVDSKIYHLNRLKTSLKSNYFEKLFTAENFDPKHNETLEIQPKNSEMFSTAIDLINGKKLPDVLNKDDYISLLEAMDHLGMEIDLKTVSEFIDNLSLKSHSPEDLKIFELYNLIRANNEFEYLLRHVVKYFSNNLEILQNHKIFASFTRDHLIELVKRIPKLDDEKRHQIVQLCTEWLCYDLENRLPHVVTMINSIKPDFNARDDSDKINNSVSKRLPKISIDEKAKQIIERCFFALLAHGGKLNPAILAVEESFCPSYDGYETDGYDWELESDKEEYEEYKPKGEDDYSSRVNHQNYEEKLRKFLENGDLYDITVRVGEKTYKLHRTILESKSGYFRNIFQAEYAEAIAQNHGILTCPSKDKEYLINHPVDASSFDAVIKYIYFDEVVYHINPMKRQYSGYYFRRYYEKPDETARLFKTADILEIDEKFLEYCESTLKECQAKVSSQEVIGILNHTYGKNKYDSLYSIFLTRHLRQKWPNIENVSQFYSTSWPVFENILKSSLLYFDDPHLILDICSKWISHDVQNRFCLLPGIARAINPHCIINDDKFKNETVADSNKSSSELVRDKLWEILSSLPYMVGPENSPKKAPMKLEEMPVFIALNWENETIKILNANLDKITSLHFPVSDIPIRLFSRNCQCPVSAAMIHDNLFIIGSNGRNYEAALFEVYNLTSKKRFSLADDFRLRTLESKSELRPISILTLLNCNNELYCCSDEGLIMKYSIKMNHWMMISRKEESRKKNLRFTSDGETLYRIYQERERNYLNDFVVEAYDFEKKKWNPISDLPLIEHFSSRSIQLTVVNDRDLAVSNFLTVLISNQDSNQWITNRILSQFRRSEDDSSSEIIIFTQCEDRMLLMTSNALYQVSSSNRINSEWEVKKKFPLKNDGSETESGIFCYKSISAVHRPRLCIN